MGVFDIKMGVFFCIKMRLLIGKGVFFQLWSSSNPQKITIKHLKNTIKSLKNAKTPPKHHFYTKNHSKTSFYTQNTIKPPFLYQKHLKNTIFHLKITQNHRKTA
jgi:hypothetical protein